MRICAFIVPMLLAGLLFASGGHCSGTKGDAGLAKNLDELIARYDSTSCKECHEEIYDQWANSLHAISAYGSGGGRTAATFITAIEKGFMLMPYSGVKGPDDVRKKHLMGCAKCHLPQLAEASEEAVKEFVKTLYTFVREGDEKAEAKIEALNINCLICHNYKAITHHWVDGWPEPNAVYGNSEGEHEHDVYSVMKKSPIMSESILCGQCHGQGPNMEFENPTQCATLWGSYIFAYIPEGGHKTCQECHMSTKGHDIKAYTDKEMIEAAVDFEVDALAYYWRKNKEEGVLPMGVVKVNLTNRTGHTIPDG